MLPDEELWSEGCLRPYIFWNVRCIGLHIASVQNIQKNSAPMKCLMDSWQFIWNVRLSNHHFFFFLGHHGDDAPHLWPWGTDITNVAISTALLSAYQKGRGWRMFPCCYCCWFPWTTNPGTRFSGLACGKSLHLERSSAARNSHEWTRKKTLLRTNTRHRRWWPDYQRCDMTSHHWSNVNLKPFYLYSTAMTSCQPLVTWQWGSDLEIAIGVPSR